MSDLTSMISDLEEYQELVDAALDAVDEVVERADRARAVSERMRPQAFKNLFYTIDRKLKPALKKLEEDP